MSFATASGCGGGPTPQPPAEPRAIDVAPAPPRSSAIATEPAPDRTDATAADPEAAPPISIGTNVICELRGGRVHCTHDLDPQIAIGDAAPMPGIEDAIDVAHGSAFACAVTRRGEVRCWGANEWGQLGAGLAALKSDAPVVVRGVTGARRVFAGSEHACAIVGGGHVSCWGKNESGQTGSSTYYMPNARELATATPVDPVHDAYVIAPGRATTCALTTSREARQGFCWGRPILGGRAKNNANDKPGLVPTLAHYSDVSASDGALCGVRDGGVSCFGELYSLVATGVGVAPPDGAPVEGVKDATRVRIARSHACALLRDGSVTCWGMNYAGALGRSGSSGSGYDRQPPETVAGLPATIVDVVVGDQMSCAVAGDRKIYCWGTFPGSRPNTRRKEVLPVALAR